TMSPLASIVMFIGYLAVFAVVRRNPVGEAVEACRSSVVAGSPECSDRRPGGRPDCPDFLAAGSSLS
ncbi:hypothetical protein OSI40_06850, partial [Mycobacterium ulcerans]